MKDIIQNFCKDIVDKYGELQVVIAIEELSELQKELTKHLRKKGKKEHIIEEIADVQLIIEEMKIFFDIKQDDIYKVKRKKIKRTYNQYLEKENDENDNADDSKKDIFDILEGV